MTIVMDTHLHSKASDGLWTPSEVVRQAKLRGLEVIALTDHDTTFGVPEALNAAKENGIRVIPGIEIDAEYRSAGIKVEDIELLGLEIDLDLIQPFVKDRTEDRIKSLRAYTDAFNSYIDSPEFSSLNEQKKYPLSDPLHLSVDKIIEWRNRVDDYPNPAPFLSKMDIVFYLLDHFAAPSKEVELAKTRDRFYAGEFKKEYGFLFKGKETKPTFFQAIDAVKKAGGFAVLAHPGLFKGYEGGMVKEWERDSWFKDTDEFTPFKFISELVEGGLDGVELYYYKGNDKVHADSHNRINEYFTNLADRLDLIITYGSDCHGPKGNGPMMGLFGSETVYL
jgi:predicted metal-dependent phosphoesterase TrpH